MAAVLPQAASALDDSAELYRLIAETIPLMVWTARPDGEVDFLNRRVLDYTGRTAVELRGWLWQQVVHPDDREACLANWTRALQSGERCETEMRLRRADGQYRWHHGTGVPLRGANGHVTRWFGVCADIEDQCRSTRILEATVAAQTRELGAMQSRLRGILENEPECVKVLDVEGRLVEMNGAGLRMVEADSIAPLLGKSVETLLAEEHRSAFRALIERVCRGERGVLEFEIVGLKGTRRWLESHAVPLRDEASGTTQLLAITRDISDRKRAERALRETEQRFQLFMEHLPLQAWIRDAQFRYTYVNARYAAAKLSPAQMLGQDPAHFYPPEVAESFRRTDDEVRRSGAPMQWVDELPGGRYLKVKFPIPGPAGEVHVGGVALDISDRVRLEEALRDSEQRFRLFMNHVPVVAWLKDSKLRYTYVNKQFEASFDRTSADVLGREVSQIYPSELARHFEATDRKVLDERQPLQYLERPLPQARAGGNWLKIKFPVPEAGGGLGVGGIAIDMSERVRLAALLRESEDKHRTLVELSCDGIVVRQDGRLVYANPAAVALLGAKSPGQILGRAVRDLTHPSFHDALEERERRLARGESLPPQETRLLRVDGSDLWAETSGAPLTFDGRPAALSVIRDLSRRREADERARRHAEDVRMLLDRLVGAQEQERRRLANDLHDLIGQNLTALGLELSALRASLPPESAQRVAPRLAAMTGLVDGTIESIRGVMTELRPPELEQYGLVPAVRWYASAFGARTGIRISMNVAGNVPRLAADAELALFRILQEALTNAAKHSGCAAIEVVLCEHAGGIRLTAEDDGRGFDNPVGARTERRGGWGLPAMRERAEAHGGTLRIEFPGRGARLIAEIPGRGH